MKANELVYLAVLGVALAVALAIEFNATFWASWVIPFFAVFTLVWLVVLGPILRVSGRWLSRTTVGYLVALVLIWYLPLNPIERFVQAVGHLHVGMSAPVVESVMAGQIKGAHLSGSDGISVIQRQPYAGKTYFEPQGQGHSFDTCCLVSWQQGRISDIEVYLD